MAREFEFLIKPPKAVPPKPRQFSPRTPERRLAQAKQSIERSEKYLAENQNEGTRRHYQHQIARAIVTAPEELRTAERVKQAREYAEAAVGAGDSMDSFARQQFLNTLALAMLRSGNAGEATASFKSNLARGVSDTTALFDTYGLALAQIQNSDDDAARKTYEQSIAMQKARAPYLQDSNQWNELYHLREELQTHFLGENPRDMIAQADSLIEEGKFKDAAKVFDRLLTVYHHDAWTWYRSATLQIYVGNNEPWRRQCEQMASLFADVDDAYVLERIGKSTLLAAAPNVARVQAQGFIEQANALEPDSMWFALARGLAMYRGGEYPEAVASLERSLTLKGRTRSADVCIYSLLALSHFRLDEEEAATDKLNEAESAFKKLPKPGRDKLGSNWHDTLIAEILLREARSIVQE